MEENQAPPKECPFCRSDETVKNGSCRGLPRRLCKTCGKCYNGRPPKGYPAETRRNAVKLYSEGVGISATARYLDCSKTSVLNWIKQAEAEITHGQRPGDDLPDSASVLEMDEMWHFVKKKSEKLWVWMAFNRLLGKPVAFALGDRDKKACRELYEKTSHIHCDEYATDDWGVYPVVLPAEKHKVGKRGTCGIESFNANVRHYLARFARKTRCYSKTSEMVAVSLNLLFNKDKIPSLQF